MKKFLITAALTTACIGTAPPQAEAPKNILDNIQITADSMQYDTSRKHAHAHGNVKLIYKVKGQPVTLTATDLQAHFDEDGKLVKSVAEGNVEIETESENGKSHLCAQTCTHDFNTHQVVCDGTDVKLTQKNNELLGNKATLDFDTQVFTMHADAKKQITSVIYPEKEKRHKNP